MINNLYSDDTSELKVLYKKQKRFTDTSFIYSRNGGKNVKFNKYL